MPQKAAPCRFAGAVFCAAAAFPCSRGNLSKRVCRAFLVAAAAGGAVGPAHKIFIARRKTRAGFAVRPGRSQTGKRKNADCGFCITSEARCARPLAGAFGGHLPLRGK